MAIHWALNHWRVYLLGRKFTVVTDHAALKWLFSPTRRDPHHRHDRLILDLQQFDFVVTHRAGTAHGNADSLSRVADLIEQPSVGHATSVDSAALVVNVVLRSQTGNLPARLPRVDSEWVGRDAERDLANAIKSSFEESGLSQISPDILCQSDESHPADCAAVESAAE